MNSAGQTWNDNIIWVKGNCLQRDDEELLDLRFRSVKQREKVAEGRFASVDNLKEVEERARFAILQGKEDTGQMLGIEEQESELKKANSKLEKNLVRAKTEALKEVRQLKAAHTVAIGQLQVKAKANLEEMAEERDRLVLDNQDDGVELPEGGSEKDVREMSLRINDLKSGLAREREASKALLSVQAELQVELDVSHAHEDYTLMYNWEFAEQFDKMEEANENKEDQYVKVYFRLEKLNQAVSDLTRQVEENDFGIKKGLEDLSETTERAKNLQHRVDALALRGKQADMAQYRIQALERTKELCRSDLHRYKIDLERIRQKFIGKDDECDDLNERVARLKAERDQAIARAKKAEGNVQKGNVNLRKCQHKLDTALIKEKVLEGEIKAKELLVKKKDELLKDLPAREELNAELRWLRTQIEDLEAMNLAELAKYITKLEADVIYHDRADAEITEWKDNCARLKVRYESLKTKFAIAIIPGMSRSDLLRVIVAYFVVKVKKLESERDTLLKTLSDKGCTCRAKIDRDNCRGAMETQLSPQTVESIARGKVVVARKLKDRPLDDVGESITNTPSALKNLL
ncbi:hypothetical protein GIB67_025108 [Kingdonia uniflora]|uniref:Uncharacterized protein n=1 Tax=Kingdonia uniflora TaxID=39325 RepID=A0A7J7N880_9MAGN|nr:hypothetical protein GIB67_025108 [Kingdonia uniflora]